MSANETTAVMAPSDDRETGLLLRQFSIAADWVNASGHMRAAHYVVLFEEAFDTFRANFIRPGSGARGAAPFLLEMHTCYLWELVAQDVVSVRVQVVGLDRRRLHLMLVMLKDDRQPAATTELSITNFNLAERKSEAWDAAQMDVLADLHRAHAAMPKPVQAGRAIAPVMP